jgi:hypothetical protein
LVLYNFINLKGFKILTLSGPTYWPTSLWKKSDILDIFVINTPRNLFCTTTNLLEPSSEHTAILLSINVSPPIRPSSPKLFPSSTDRRKFHDLVDKNIKLQTSFKSTLEIDIAINNLINIIQLAAWASSPAERQYPNPVSSVLEHICILISNKCKATALY